MTNPTVNFTDSGQGATFKEGDTMIISHSGEIVTAALWSGKNLVIIGQQDSLEPLKIKVKRWLLSLKGPARLTVHWYENSSWEGIEFPFTIV